jgi:thioredoxin reductase (NADPH)
MAPGVIFLPFYRKAEYMKQKTVLIIGGGIAGLTAAIYVQRAGHHALLFETGTFGGQILNAAKIENYPGFNGISGGEFSWNVYDQTVKSGAEIHTEKVLTIQREKDGITLTGSSGTYHGDALIYAAGADHRKLGLPDEDALRGHGISYCATCDGAFFRGQTVAVYGSGNTAVSDAIYLSGLAKKVLLIHRHENFHAEEILIEEAEKSENIEILDETQVTDLISKDGKLSALKLNSPEGESIRKVNGLFVAVGTVPNTDLLKGLVSLDEKGYIRTDEKMFTGTPGIYAAGDVRSKGIRQLTTAASDGTIAAMESTSA